LQQVRVYAILISFRFIGYTLVILSLLVLIGLQFHLRRRRRN